MQRLSKKPVLSKERVSVEKAPEPAMASQVCRNFDTTMREQLNLKPTFWIFLPTFLYGVVTATFLELYVTTATSHIVVFVIGSYCVFSRRVAPPWHTPFPLGRHRSSGPRLSHHPCAPVTLCVTM